MIAPDAPPVTVVEFAELVDVLMNRFDRLNDRITAMERKLQSLNDNIDIRDAQLKSRMLALEVPAIRTFYSTPSTDQGDQ